MTERCRVSLYDNCKLEAWAVVSIGRYRSNDLATRGVRMNALTGIKIEGEAGCQVELYDGDNFSGDKRVWSMAGTKFSDGGCHHGPNDEHDFSDRAESIKIRLAGARAQHSNACFLASLNVLCIACIRVDIGARLAMPLNRWCVLGCVCRSLV